MKYIVYRVMIDEDEQQNINDIAESIKDSIYDSDEPVADVFYDVVNDSTLDAHK